MSTWQYVLKIIGAGALKLQSKVVEENFGCHLNYFFRQWITTLKSLNAFNTRCIDKGWKVIEKYVWIPFHKRDNNIKNFNDAQNHSFVILINFLINKTSSHLNSLLQYIQYSLQIIPSSGAWIRVISWQRVISTKVSSRSRLALNGKTLLEN